MKKSIIAQKVLSDKDVTILNNLKKPAVAETILTLNREKQRDTDILKPQTPFEQKSLVDLEKTIFTHNQQPKQNNKKQKQIITIDPISSAQPIKEKIIPKKTEVITIDTKFSGEEKADIYLNFENTNLSNFINYISELKKINIVPDKKIANTKISLSMRQPLTPTGAWNVFLTLSDMAGFTILKHGDIYKVVPNKEKIKNPLPAFINVSHTTLPDTDETIRYVTFLNNIQAKEIKGILNSIIGTPSSIIVQTALNGLIITGKSQDIKSGMEVVSHLDQPGLQESVVVMQLTEANATDVKNLFSSLMKKPQGHPLARLLGKKESETIEYFPPTTKIIAEERTNKLILLGNIQSIQKIEKFVTEHIDTTLKNIESPLHIYELQYADASQVAEILQTVTSSRELETSMGRQTAKYGGVRGGVKYFKDMRFKVDKEGNRLIVSSTDKQDWKLLKKTIRDLDKANPQVAMETLIVAVTLNDRKELGAQMRNKRTGMLGKHIDIQTAHLKPPILKAIGDPLTPVSLLGNLISAFSGAIGSTVLSFGAENTGGVWGALQMIKEHTNTSILSQPFMTIANNAKGVISIGETRRIQEQQAVSDGGSIGDATGFISKKVATKVEITPQINLDGIIKFDIDVEFNEFLNDRGDTQERKLNTTATVADGQVLVLGGFVRTKVTESTSKTPILGDIPLLGWLFKNKRRTVEKDYIFIFMCPTILKPRITPGVELYTKMKLHQAANDIESAIETKRVLDPIHNWFFNKEEENYEHKVVDFANARYQPTTVDIANDPYYRTKTKRQEKKEESLEKEIIPIKKEQLVKDVHPTPLEMPLKIPAKETTIMNRELQLDRSIEDKRKALKEMLSKNPLVLPEQNKQAELKSFFEEQPSVFPAQGALS